MKQMITLLLATGCFLTVAGRHYYEEHRVLKSTSDI